MTSQPNKPADKRRDFLRESLMLAAVPAGLAGGVAQAAIDSRSSQAATLRVGLLGCGRRGLQLSKSALSSNVADVRIVALADLFADRIQQTYRTLNSNHSDKLSMDGSSRLVGMRAVQMLAASDVDAVIIAAATGFRPQHVRELVEAGKHVYVEQPLATDLQGLEELSELATRAAHQRIVLFGGIQHRYQPFYRTLVEQLQNGIIGQPVLAQLDCTLKRQLGQQVSKTGEFENKLRNWQLDARLGGHPLLQNLVSNIDLMNWIAGDLPIVDQARFDSDANSYDVNYIYKDTRSAGLRLNCHVSYAESPVQIGTRLQIQGSHGWCDVIKGRIYDSANRQIWSAVGSSTELQSPIDHWLSSLATPNCPNSYESLLTDTTAALSAARCVMFEQHA